MRRALGSAAMPHSSPRLRRPRTTRPMLLTIQRRRMGKQRVPDRDHRSPCIATTGPYWLARTERLPSRELGIFNASAGVMTYR